MKTGYIIYLLATGEIVRSGTAPDHMLDIQAKDGEAILKNEIADNSIHYIRQPVTFPVRISKPTSLVTIDKTEVLADSVDYVVLSSIPTEASLTITGMGENIELPTSGDQKAITFDTAGEYTLGIKCFPYLDFEVKVNVS